MSVSGPPSSSHALSSLHPLSIATLGIRGTSERHLQHVICGDPVAVALPNFHMRTAHLMRRGAGAGAEGAGRREGPRAPRAPCVWCGVVWVWGDSPRGEQGGKCLVFGVALGSLHPPHPPYDPALLSTQQGVLFVTCTHCARYTTRHNTIQYNTNTNTVQRNTNTQAGYSTPPAATQGPPHVLSSHDRGQATPRPRTRPAGPGPATTATATSGSHDSEEATRTHVHASAERAPHGHDWVGGREDDRHGHGHHGHGARPATATAATATTATTATAVNADGTTDDTT